jgi:hypothetical protein
MPTPKDCWICKGVFADPWKLAGDNVVIECGTCGPYYLSLSMYSSAFPMPDTERYRVSHWNKMREIEGREPVAITRYTLPGILAALPNPLTHEKRDLLLLALTRLHAVPGNAFEIDSFRNYPLACARDLREFEFHLAGVVASGAVQEIPRPGGARYYVITYQGWETAAKLATEGGANSKTAFVAMKFSDEMLALWEPVFQAAIERAGFEPRLVGDPEHNDRIDAKIVAEIKQSRFVIADMTYGSQGVYFEAGYAIGLGRPVIWTCRRDREKEDMHFDTRQYAHILWSTPEELKEALYNRIVGTI